MRDAETDEIEESIVDINVSDEMQTSYLEYAYSVIYSRALPDARDGLKPVQRRILYSMDQMGLRPDKAHVKSARVVGEVMGKLHPHGDSAIYDALVRLAQSWTMRLPVLDGHGNFGSLDAGPAAMRYTECRMAPSALAMTQGLDEETVDFRPNYDGKELEPMVLPAAFPNLLVNGTSGIAVGMATNMAPHNLIEVVAGLRHLLTHPDASLDDLMRFIPGPDLPTGGTVIGLAGIKDAYETGRGSFKIRATARIENVSPRRRGIVFTELPYQTGPERIIEQIKNLVQSKKLTGISDIKDLTDLEHGTRLVVEVKNGINPDVLLEQLYKHTKLEDTFGMNNVALVDGQPRTMGLKELMQVYLDHRIEVVLRRSQHRLGKAQERLHLVDGLLIAIVDIDEVIEIVRTSDDAGQARTRLVSTFDLTEVQANYILDMQLRRLTKMSRIELESERGELADRIDELTRIIDEPDRLRATVSTELAEIAKLFGSPRRTVLLAASGSPAPTAPLEVSDDPCWVLLSSTGLIARTENADPLPDSGPRGPHDLITSAIRTTAHGEFGVVTSNGRLIKARAIELPTIVITVNAPDLRGGSDASELYPLSKGERIVCVVRLDAASLGLAVGTRDGVVKRVKAEVLSKESWDIITLDDGDSIIGAAELTCEQSQLCFITDDAQLLHFPANKVRPTGRNAGGVAGIKLNNDAHVIFFGVITPDAETSNVVVTVSGSSEALPGTGSGLAKVTPFVEYPAKGRATGGVRCHRFLKTENSLVLAWAGNSPAIAATASGDPIDLPLAVGKRDGSGTPLPYSISAIASRLAGGLPPASREDHEAHQQLS